MRDEGGDPACWLSAVCEACGALVGEGEHECAGSRRAAGTDPAGEAPHDD